MKKFKITLLVCCLLGLSYQNFALADDQTQTVVTSQKVADSSNPYTLIATLADNTFSSIKANKDKLSDAMVARKIIETELLPYIDNKYAAYKVIGSNLKNTTEKQRDDFTQAFTKYIVATYADALKKYTNQSIEVQTPEEIKDKIVAVKVFIKEAGKPDLEVIFKMRQNQKTNTWKAYDMVAEGISLLSAKQSELSSLIRQHGIDYVSNMLEEHVKNTAK
ncbi:MAG: ABC transporter substrate-binding protein [Succinivibrionaceae bacterium]|nr:ABC transporter substrate-binding protein [Succinivibrionaceae bacterium]